MIEAKRQGRNRVLQALGIAFALPTRTIRVTRHEEEPMLADSPPPRPATGPARGTAPRANA